MKKRPSLLLINPWAYDFAVHDLYSKPYGLLSLAANLRKAGFSLSFLDCMDRQDPYFRKNRLVNEKRYGTGKIFHEVIEKPEILKDIPRYYKRYGLPYSEVRKRLEELSRSPVRAVLVSSMMTYWYPGVFDMIKLVREYFRDTPVILGGLYVNLLPDHAGKYSGADHVLTGSHIPHLIREISVLLGHTPGGQDSTFEEEPAFDLYDQLTYLAVMLTRGCPFHCSYCASGLLHKGFSVKDIGRVRETALYYMNEFRVSDIAFYDDALLFRFRSVLKKFLEPWKGRDINFHTPNGLHLCMIDREKAEYLYQYNFKTLRLSLETSDRTRQKETGSKVSNRDFVRAVGHLRKAGFQAKDLDVYILAGFPDQTVEEVKKSMDFVKENGATPRLVEYSLIPGTADYRRYFKDMFIDPLLHNNSIFCQKYGHFSYENLTELREYART
ncbi:MAG: B12-binding domain-containing radical SAM protein [bacterium]|nr:B12-binding domain-containing radical SAM protein [bacterium]